MALGCWAGGLDAQGGRGWSFGAQDLGFEALGFGILNPKP